MNVKNHVDEPRQQQLLSSLSGDLDEVLTGTGNPLAAWTACGNGVTRRGRFQRFLLVGSVRVSRP